ncbi:thermonuclease family protein [Saliphagus infecundisoli]|uniref:Thermonuclease family protein n=1 Tax=Saliphagus infecundisoli TaxID=1849069 RepID=A0ABD5QIN9_9EURY|nr:thermonuclease family protein [Saliphagus infecundisoli]
MANSNGGDRLDRRGFLAGVGAAVGSLALPATVFGSEAASAAEGVELDRLTFYSSASQIAADGESELGDEDHVVVWAEPTAYNFETTADGPETVVYDENPIPLVSEDGGVVGIGTADFVSDSNGGFDADNEQFMLNLFDARMGGEGTVVWDEGHDQFYELGLDYYDSFRQYAGDSGYDLRATTDLLGSGSLTLPSTASQVAPDGGALTDPERVMVWAEDTAENVDNAGDEAAHLYGEDEEIPLISREGDVVGFGTPELIADDDFGDANKEFALALLEDTIGASGTVVWDDAHDTFYDSSNFGAFADAVENEGYGFEASEDLLAGSGGSGGGSTEGGVLAADPATPGEPSTHTWTLEDLAFGESGADGDEVDTIAVEYESASLDGLTDDDVTVTMTRTLSGGPDTTEISVNQGSYGGSSATFDLSGSFQSDVAGPVIVEIDGVENPAESETATITLKGDADPVSVEAELAVGDGISDLEGADLLAVPSPSEAYTDNELAALDDHLAGGGAVFLLDQSDYNGYDETPNLNAIADHLDLGFRFNADQVEDPENNAGAPYVPTTANFNDGFDVFSDLGGIGLADADGLVVASPTEAFSGPELDALSSFVDSGGAVFLLDESDFGGVGNTETGFDETENLNGIADALELAFRFNSDQVNNGDGEFDIETTNFNTDFDYFAERDTVLGIDFDPAETYYGRIVSVIDGDTVDVEFDGEYDYTDRVRTLGFDTPETGGGNEIEEWFGIESESHLDEWGGKAASFSLDRLAPDGAGTGESIEGRRIELSFDEVEPLRGNYGRLLGYLSYDPDDFDAGPDGNYTAEYNLEMVEEGYARVYSSGFARHDEFAATEEAALADGRGVWEASDFEAVPEHRNDPVEEVYVPRASSITTSSGPLPADRSPVLAGESAEQDSLGGEFESYDDAPLVGVDEDSRVGMVGGVLIDEAYEEDEDLGVDTSGYGNFPLVTNLAASLSENDGDFLIEGGHAQFGAAGSISLEDARYYLRFVEGVGSRLRQINDVVNTLPEEDEPTAVFLTAPGRAYTDAELAALAEYRDAGGAVVLLGSAEASAAHRGNLEAVAAGLGSDLRLNDDRVIDPESNLADDPGLPVTGRFDERFGLFHPVGEPPVEELTVRYGEHDPVSVGSVTGDVHVSGSAAVPAIEIAGDVGGDLVVDGAAEVGEISVAGDVAGEVRITAGSLVADVAIDGSVGGLALRGNAAVEGGFSIGSVAGAIGLAGSATVEGDLSVAGDVADGVDLSGASAIEGTLSAGGVGGDVVLRGSPTVGAIEIEELEGEVIDRSNPQVGSASGPGQTGRRGRP